MNIAGSETAALELRPLPQNEETLIPRGDLPSYIGIAEQTLARWAHEGYGPGFVKLGRRVFYRSGELRAWIQAQSRSNTIT